MAARRFFTSCPPAPAPPGKSNRFPFRALTRSRDRRAGRSIFPFFAMLVGSAFCFAPRAAAQENAYFVTYTQALEEPGNLEVEFRGTTASPKNGNQFLSGTIELEYGTTRWWTTEFYLSGQSTLNDSTIFNGFRVENRFRPFLKNHVINPVFYVEYENLNRADRSVLEVTGHDSITDLIVPNSIERPQLERSIETKLILGSNFRGWNFSENFIAEKDLNEPEPWEFGYALGVSHRLGSASSSTCLLCRKNFRAGAELFGGLSTLDDFGWKGTSQYLGPIVSFRIPHGPLFMFSPDFGLNANSVGVVYRIKVSYEFENFLGRSHKGDR